jgi:hypothetical protein
MFFSNANAKPKPKSLLNSFWFGYISGMIVPVITIYVFYLVRWNAVSFSYFYHTFVEATVFSALISLAALPDGLLFFLFIWSNRLYGARGVLGAIFTYTLIVVAYKFLIQ